MPPADTNFRQIKIILISHVTTFLLFIFPLVWCFSFSSKNSNKEGNVKHLLHTVFILNWQAKYSTSFFREQYFYFELCRPWNLDYYCYFANRPTRNNSPGCPFSKKLSCRRLTYEDSVSFWSVNPFSAKADELFECVWRFCEFDA